MPSCLAAGAVPDAGEDPTIGCDGGLSQPGLADDIAAKGRWSSRFPHAAFDVIPPSVQGVKVAASAIPTVS